MASGTLDTPAGTAPTPSAGPNGNGRAAIPARTLRTDNWRKAPIITVVLLTLWILYAVVRAFMQKWYWVEDYHYLTPFYSPCVSNGCDGDAVEFGRFLPDIADLPVRRADAAVPAAVPAHLLLLPARPTTARSGSRRRPARCRTATRRTRARRGCR